MTQKNKLPKAETSPITGEEKALTRGHKKKARTRQSLVEAALRIYAQKGIGELHLNELAEEAQVSNGTVYNYFRSREEVLDAVGVELASQFSLKVSTLSQGIDNGAERLSVGVRMFIEQTLQDPLWASAVVCVYQYDQNIRSAVVNSLRHDLQLGLQQGHFHVANEDIAMRMVTASTMGVMTAVLDGCKPDNVDSIVAESVLLSLGMERGAAKRVAYLPLPDSSCGE